MGETEDMGRLFQLLQCDREKTSDEIDPTAHQHSLFHLSSLYGFFSQGELKVARLQGGARREIRFVAIVTGVSQTQQSKTNDFLVTLLSSSSLPHSQPEFHPAYQIRVSQL